MLQMLQSRIVKAFSRNILCNKSCNKNFQRDVNVVKCNICNKAKIKCYTINN